jgi:tRNA-specific 2-thiouridylase
MSGGVDSSVVAALLKQRGHDVVGITLQLYDHGAATARKGSCCAGQDIHDAREVAQALEIPHYVLDYERRFERSVMAAFADSYLAGETPIPCVTCNQQIKFHELLETAKELGADVLATGHYIERRDGEAGPALHRAADRERDQSYFLFATTRKQLSNLWFPLGGMRKAEVRALARQFKLPVAEKSDSQDICFVPTGRYTQVIERLRPDAAKAGDIVHVNGKVLGSHDGIVNFTIGQRRGLKIASAEPLYVLRLDATSRRVIVGPRENLSTAVLELRDVNWIGPTGFAETGRMGLEIYARIRSTQTPVPAQLSSTEDGCARVVLAESEYGVAPGQACVLYADGSPRARLLGGGWIARTLAGLEDNAVAATGGTKRPASGEQTPTHSKNNREIGL